MSNIIKQTGIVKLITPIETGSSAKGEWKKQTVVLTQTVEKADKSTFTRELALEAFNKDLQVQVGQEVEVDYTVSSREYKGRWFTNASMLSIKATQGATAQGMATQPAESLNPSDNDLPF